MPTREHPLAVLLEPHCSDVAIVAIIAIQRLGVIGVDIKHPDLGVSGSSYLCLVSRDFQLVDLRVGVLQGSVADAAGGLPEADGVVYGCSVGGWQRETRAAGPPMQTVCGLDACMHAALTIAGGSQNDRGHAATCPTALGWGELDALLCHQ